LGDLARHLCETRPEKLKSEARRAESGHWIFGEGQQAPSPPAKGSGERCKLTQWGHGRSYGNFGFWCISGLEQSSNFDIL